MFKQNEEFVSMVSKNTTLDDPTDKDDSVYSNLFSFYRAAMKLSAMVPRESNNLMKGQMMLMN